MEITKNEKILQLIRGRKHMMPKNIAEKPFKHTISGKPYLVDPIKYLVEGDASLVETTFDDEDLESYKKPEKKKPGPKPGYKKIKPKHTPVTDIEKAVHDMYLGDVKSFDRRHSRTIKRFIMGYEDRLFKTSTSYTILSPDGKSRYVVKRIK